MKKLLLTTALVALMAGAPAAFAADADYNNDTSATGTRMDSNTNTSTDTGAADTETRTTTDANGTGVTTDNNSNAETRNTVDSKTTTKKMVKHKKKKHKKKTMKKMDNTTGMNETDNLNSVAPAAGGMSVQSTARHPNAGELPARSIIDDSDTSQQGQPTGEIQGPVNGQSDDQNYGQPYNH